MKYRALIGLAALGSWGCGAGDMEDIEVSRLAVNVGTGAQFKSMLTADPYGSYTLTANIDMAGAELHVAAFYGTLNGGGFTIKNVTQRLSSSSEMPAFSASSEEPSRISRSAEWTSGR
jgi:hypothetical protein